MRIINLKTMASDEISCPSVVALGTFDGCHMAHKEVLRKAFLLARKNGAASVAYTFDSVPKTKNGDIGAIYTIDEKIKAIKKMGLDYIAIDTFDDIKNLSPEEFFSNVLKNALNATHASCGYNYKFGKGASAGADDLGELFLKNGGGSVVISNEIMVGKSTVSSTLIRNLIREGEVETLFSLGSNYSVYAPVVEGKHLATKMGIPTINQYIPKEKVVPKLGVYITECEIGEDVYPSVTNVGVRPTTDKAGEINMETHIIGYRGYLYGSFIRVNFYKYLRGEKKFSSKEELFKEIEKNKEDTVKYFK